MASRNLRLRQARRSATPVGQNFLAQQQQGFVPTQPGDPNFSMSTTPDTQAQFPAAAAEQRIYQNATSARNVLQNAQLSGYPTQGPGFDKLGEVAEKGFAERALTLGESIINFIDGPREAINLFFQDVLTQPGEGQRDPGIGDYLDALWFGIKDQDGFTEATGLDPDSASYTLDLFGWDEAETWYGKVGRGVATFGFEVLQDPLTYVTFGLSGLGRKVAKSTVDKFADDMVKQIVPAFKAGTLNVSAIESPWARRFAKNLESEVDDFVTKHLDGEVLAPDVERALKRFLTDKKGMDVPDNGWAMMELVQNNVVELAIHNKIRDEVMSPALRRAWEEIPADALEDMPKYMYGGMRIAIPFTQRSLTQGIVVPGTQGLGKRLVGDHLRNVSAKLKKTVPGYNKLSKSMKDFARNLDQDRPLLEGLAKKEGGIEGWQYHLMQTARDRMQNLEHKERIFATMNALGDNVRRAAEKAGVEDESAVWASVLERMERSSNDTLLSENLDAVLRGPVEGVSLHDDLDKEVTKLSDFLRDTLDSYYDVLKGFNPAVVDQYIRGYVPHVIDDSIGVVLGELAGKGGVIGRREWQAMQAQGNPGGVLLDNLLNSIGKGGRIETQMGASRYFNPRSGRMNALTLTDSGSMLFDGDYLKGLKAGMEDLLTAEGGVGTLKSTYFTVKELNDMVAPLVKRLADEHNIVLPKGWQGEVFKTNPLDIVFGYVNNLDEVVTSWGLMDALRTAGLAFEHSTAPNVQDMLQSMYGNMVKNLEDIQVPGAAAPRLPASAYGRSSDVTGAVIDDAGKLELVYHPELGEFDLPLSHMDAMNKLGKEVGDEGTIAVNLVGADGMPSITTHSWDGLTDVARRRVAELMDHHGYTQFRVADREAARTLDVADELAKASGTTKRVLKGYEDHVASGALPTRVVKSTSKAGFASPDDARGIMRLVAQGQEAFRNLRKQPLEGRMDPMSNFGVTFPKGKAGWEVVTTELPDGSRAATHIFRDKGGDPLVTLSLENTADGPLLSFQHVRQLSKREALQAGVQVMRELDNIIAKGDVKLSLRNLENLMAKESMTDQGADLVYRYLRQKLRGLDDETKELLTGGPAEVVDFQTMYDEFIDEFNTLFNEMSAAQLPDGTFVTTAGGRAVADQIAGDDLFMGRVKKLREAAKKLDDAHGFDTAVKIFSNIDDYMGLADQPGFVNPRWFALGGPAIEGMTIQPDIGLWLRQMSRNMASIYTPEGVASLKMATNSVLSWWKAMATISRPSFHIRNLVGGVWNGMIVGVGPQHYLATKNHGVTLRNALREGLDFEDALKKLPVSERPFWQAAWDNDVLSGFVSTEFRKLTTAQKQGRLAWAKVWDVDNFVLTRTGGKFMESIEDFMRMSTFRAWFDPADPSTAKVAKEMVEAVHFNYNKLTPLETRIKSIVPFFVWARRNLPLQLGQLAENPRMIQRYRAMLNSMNDNFEEDNPLATSDYYSAFATDTGWTVNAGTPYWARVMIDPDLPVRDLVDLPMPSISGVFEFANNLLGPHVTTLFDVNGQREFGDVNAPAPFNLVLQSLAAVGLYDRTTSGDVRMPYFMRTLAETALPFGREVLDPLTGGPTDPNRQARLGISPEDNPLEAGLKSVVAQLGRGLGVQMSTPADSRAASARSKEEIDAIVEQLRLQGQLPPSEGSGSSFNLDDFLLNIGR